jgi:hypothetical protein
MAIRPSKFTRGAERADAGLLLKNSVRAFVFAGVPVAGTSGTEAGVAGKGSLVIDSTNGKLYINTNTKASPTWTVVGTQS